MSSKKFEHLAMKLTLAQTLAGVAVFVEFKNVVKDFILKTEKNCYIIMTQHCCSTEGRIQQVMEQTTVNT